MQDGVGSRGGAVLRRGVVSSDRLVHLRHQVTGGANLRCRPPRGKVRCRNPTGRHDDPGDAPGSSSLASGVAGGVGCGRLRARSVQSLAFAVTAVLVSRLAPGTLRLRSGTDRPHRGRAAGSAIWPDVARRRPRFEIAGGREDRLRVGHGRVGPDRSSGGSDRGGLRKRRSCRPRSPHCLALASGGTGDVVSALPRHRRRVAVGGTGCHPPAGKSIAGR